jgi:hypothetical protein
MNAVPSSPCAALAFAPARADYLPDPAAAEAALRAAPSVAQARRIRRAGLRSQSLQRPQRMTSARRRRCRIDTPRDNSPRGWRCRARCGCPRARADRALGGALAAHAKRISAKHCTRARNCLLFDWLAGEPVAAVAGHARWPSSSLPRRRASAWASRRVPSASTPRPRWRGPPAAATGGRARNGRQPAAGAVS